MVDIRVPAFNGLMSYALLGFALYAGLMLGMMLLGERGAVAQRRAPMLGPKPRSHLPGVLIGIGLAFGTVILTQALSAGSLPAGAALALDRVPQFFGLR